MVLLFSPSEISPDKVAIYIRWSTDDQGEGTTLETQLERCKYYLGSQGWVFNERLVYVDEGYSGGTVDRPALTKLREDVKARKVECVVVYKIDRLSRSVVDIVELVLREWEGRCYVKSTTEDVNTITPTGKMFFYILVSFAEYERNVIKERTMGGKIKRAEQGLNPGFRPPYGYTKGRTPGKVEVVEHEASVVRRMFETYLKGNGVYQIAHSLNAEGLRRRGELWNQLAVRRILCNPAYVGVLEYGKTSRTTKDQRERQGLGNVVRFDRPRFARVQGAFPEIVDRKTWDEANKLLNLRSTKHKAMVSKPTYSDYLLSGLATCKCGAPIGGKSVGGGHHYYYCTARKRQGRLVCDAGHIAVHAVNTEIEKRVKALLSAEARKAFVRTVEEGLQERIQVIVAAIDHEQISLAAITERRGRLESDYRSGDLPAKLYARESDSVELAEARVQERLQGLREQLAELRQVKADSEQIQSTIDLIDTWDELNVPERKQLLRTLTAGIRLYRQVNAGEPPTLELEWIRLT